MGHGSRFEVHRIDRQVSSFVLSELHSSSLPLGPAIDMVISVTVQGHNKVISGTVLGRNNARLKTILRKPFRTFQVS